MEREPKTLQEAMAYFAVPANCRAYLVARRWPFGVECPRCGSDNVLFLEKQDRWSCRACKAAKRSPQFTLKTQTFMEDSPIPVGKWLIAMWMIGNCKNGISSCELAKDLGITQKSAWFMLHRIRLGMQSKRGGKLGGGIEVDETFIGGKARNMHARVRKAKGITQGGGGKTIVMGVLKRGGEVRTEVIPNREAVTLQPIVYEHVRKGSKVFTDEHGGYLGLEEKFSHAVINHAEAYVDGIVHTNGMENFWSLLKRGLGGTYVSVEPFHLFRYVDEQAFRYNTRKDGKRKLTDAERMHILSGQMVGKRLTFDKLTGKDGGEAQAAF